MEVTKTDTKQILVGISISLAIALTGCGTNGTDSSMSLDTRGGAIVRAPGDVVLRAPINPNEVSHDYQSATITFDINDSANYKGFYVHTIKLTGPDEALPKIENWTDELDPKFAAIEKAANLTKVDLGNDMVQYTMTVPHLDSNSTYALIPAAFLDYGLQDEGHVKRDLLAKEAVIVTTDVAPLPDPCLNVTGWMNNTKEVFKTRWIEYRFGAHLTWCFMKDKRGKPVFDGVHLYRIELNEDKEQMADTLVELVPDPADDPTFDTERDYFDCPLKEDHSYRYILQAYNKVGETEVYHDKNVTADITMDATKLPIRTCEYCPAPGE